MWLTVHRNSMWIRNQLVVTFVLFVISLLITQHVSGNHVPIVRSWRPRNFVPTCWYCAVAAWRLSRPVSMSASIEVFVASSSTNSSMDALLLTGLESLPAATAQYQHVVIKLRGRQLLTMGTWLPETCWVIKREITNNTKVTTSRFLIHTDL